MNFTLKVSSVKSIYEIPEYWTNDDYIKILDELDFPDAENSEASELRELFEMAITDLKAREAAEFLLKYKLSKELNHGQIENIAHEMISDNEAKGNANIDLQYALFNITHLLYSAFRGTFKRSKATAIEFELIFDGDSPVTLTKEIALKAIYNFITERCPLVRLFEHQLNGEELFSDAEKTVWELHSHGSNKYSLITSDSWISKECFIGHEISGSIKIYNSSSKEDHDAD